MTLDPQTAPKAFLEMTVFLGKLRGITGIPLAYVPRFTLKSPNNVSLLMSRVPSYAIGRDRGEE